MRQNDVILMFDWSINYMKQLLSIKYVFVIDVDDVIEQIRVWLWLVV